MDDKLRNFLHLMKRSNPNPEGWCKVSATVWPLVEKMPDDLIEKDKNEHGGWVRLTPRGQAVSDYL